MPLDSRNYPRETESETEEIKSNGLSLAGSLRDNLELAYRYYWEKGSSHFFYRQGIGSVHCRSFIETQNKKLLVMSPGRAESSLKYSELAYELKSKGFDIIIIDHRGQGLSERYNVAHDLGHVCRFQNYNDDLINIVEHFCEKKSYKKVIGLGHSMGGAILLGAANKAPELISGLILSSPMLKVKTRNFPELFTRYSLKILTKTHLVHTPITKREARDLKERFEGNKVSSCLQRFQFLKDLEKRHPQIKLGPPTLNWLSEAMDMGSLIVKNRKTFQTATLLMQAEVDDIVCNSAQNQFAHDMSNCRLIRLKDSRHEILQENDSIRNRAMVQIHKFLKEN